MLVTEGETDFLAAISAMCVVTELSDDPGGDDLHLERRGDLPPPIAELMPVSIPGVNNCHQAIADLAEKKAVDILIAFDGDEAGRANALQLKKIAGEREHVAAAIVHLPDGKDLADVLSGADDPTEALAELIAEAEAANYSDPDPSGEKPEGYSDPNDEEDLTPDDNRATVQPPVDRMAEWEICGDLASQPRILDTFSRQLARAGLVGEDKLAQIIFLATVSRLLPRPVNIAVKGPSAGGKSFTVETVLEHFPESAFYSLSAMSERALAYSEEPLIHRMLVIYEAAGMEGDFASYLLRSLLSEGCVRYETVEKTKDGIKARLIERPGPTGLIVTTTKTSLHPENETRLISLVVKDTPDQTRAVMRAIADEDDPDLEVEPWHALQRWLEPRRVAVPYATELAELIPAVAVRLRRDFGSVLGLVRAHALLHQASRVEDEQGRIVATIEDYGVVRELVADLVASGVGAGVSPETRETVNAVGRLAGEEGITQKALVDDLGLDKSAISRRVRVATREGYLRNLEEKRGRPARLVLGEPLPEDLEILPPPEKLHGCTVARLIEGDNQATLDEEVEAERLAEKFEVPA
jgi:hypothetical protein